MSCFQDVTCPLFQKEFIPMDSMIVFKSLRSRSPVVFQETSSSVFPPEEADEAPLVRTQVLMDIREGRKRCTQIALFSQSINDFDKTMVDLSTSVWILGAATKQAVDRAGKIFGFLDSVLFRQWRRSGLRQKPERT